MKLGRRPGSFTSFVDSFTEETILRVEASSSGEILVTFRLYDSHGALVKDSEGCQSYPTGVEVRTSEDEVLLCLPADDEGLISYCLYNASGALLTRSDGMRTQLFGGVRIVGNKPLSGRPPAAKAPAEVAAAAE